MNKTLNLYSNPQGHILYYAHMYVPLSNLYLKEQFIYHKQKSTIFWNVTLCSPVEAHRL
jgi:hypothetical protein